MKGFLAGVVLLLSGTSAFAGGGVFVVNSFGGHGFHSGSVFVSSAPVFVQRQRVFVQQQPVFVQRQRVFVQQQPQVIIQERRGLFSRTRTTIIR